MTEHYSDNEARDVPVKGKLFLASIGLLLAVMWAVVYATGTYLEADLAERGILLTDWVVASLVWHTAAAALIMAAAVGLSRPRSKRIRMVALPFGSAVVFLCALLVGGLLLSVEMFWGTATFGILFGVIAGSMPAELPE